MIQIYQWFFPRNAADATDGARSSEGDRQTKGADRFRPREQAAF
jgi:hypothetical protein